MKWLCVCSRIQAKPLEAILLLFCGQNVVLFTGFQTNKSTTLLYERTIASSLILHIISIVNNMVTIGGPIGNPFPGSARERQSNKILHNTTDSVLSPLDYMSRETKESIEKSHINHIIDYSRTTKVHP